MNSMRSRWAAFFYFVQLFVLFSALATVFFVGGLGGGGLGAGVKTRENKGGGGGVKTQ